MQRIRLLPIILTALVCGTLFGFGLAWSTMVRPEAILQFLMLKNMGLLLVMGGAAGVTFVAYHGLPRIMKHPVFAHTFHRRSSCLETRTLLGAAIFGVGWGLSGVCPGPAIAGLGVGNWPLVLSVIGIALGAWIEGRYFRKMDQ